MSELNEREKAALRYYIGDVSGSDPFWGDPKAYVVLNSLFFPGIATERARAAEGKRLNPALLDDIERLTELITALFSAFRHSASGTELRTFRVEREADFRLCQSAGATLSFTSTSKSCFLSEYRDRLGIALMRFTVPAGALCIDVGEALDFYAKPEEAEVLLPPFTELTVSEQPVAGSEQCILDAAGKPPVCSCEVTVGGIKQLGEGSELPDGGEKAGQRVFAALNAGKSPAEEDAELFGAWKRAYTARLNRIFTGI